MEINIIAFIWWSLFIFALGMGIPVGVDYLKRWFKRNYKVHFKIEKKHINDK